MKKVLFIATVSGHIKMFHTPYLDLFKKNQWKVYVAAKWNGDDKSIISKYCDVMIDLPISRSPLSVSNIKSISILKKICEKEKFDIIHCHTPMGSVVARLAAQKTRKKNHTRVIYTAHGFHFYKGAPLKNWIIYFSIEKFLSKYTDTLITINKEDYNLAKEKFSKNCNDIEYVPGVGIDNNRFDCKMSQKDKIELRKKLGLKKDDFVLIFPARLDINKNQIFLIKCMNEIVNYNKNIHLLLVGNDELNGYYQSLVDNNLKNNIHFLGLRNDIPNLLSISNVSVSSSLREGLPINVIEAFSTGIPVVALNCRGMNDLVENGVNGFLIENSDVSSFSKKIIYLFENQDEYNKICINNKNKSKQYDISSIVDIMEKIYFVKRGD